MIIDDDKIIAELGGNVLASGKAALKRTVNALIKKCPLSRRLPCPATRQKRPQKVNELGCQVRLFYLGSDTVGDILQRIENRVKCGGHNIPQDHVNRRFQGR